MTGETVRTAAEHVAVVERAIELVNNREFHRSGEVLHSRFVRHDLAGAYPGVTDSTVVDYLAEVLAGAPDLQIKVEDVFAGADRAAVRLTLEGTHEAMLFGRPATGRRFPVNQVNIYRFEDGKIAETWQLADVAGFMKQIEG